MDLSIFHALLQNAALLVAMVFLADATTRRRDLVDRLWRRVLLGILIGLLGIGVILAAFPLLPGVVFDTRSVLLVISGLFLGAVPTAVAMGMTAAFRLAEGGIAVGTGIAVIAASGLIGIAWQRYRRGPLADITGRELYALGLVVHTVMLALMLTLPWEVAKQVLAQVSLPVLVVFPFATVSLGLLLAGRLRRERALDALAESEARYRGIFTNNHAVMLLIDPGTGAIVDANPAACQFYGWTHPELLQRRITDLNTLPPEGIQAEMERARAARRHQFFFPHRRADGSVRDVEVFSGPVTLGGRTLLYSIVHDITERRHAEDALRNSEQLFSGIIHAIPVRVSWKDLNLVYLGCNAACAQDAGLADPREIVGKDDFQLRWGGEAERYRADDRRIMTTGEPKMLFEEPMLARDGTAGTLLTSKVPLRNAAGEVVGILGVYLDITDRKRAEETTRQLVADLHETQRVLLRTIEEQKRAEAEREALFLRAEQSRRTLLSVVEDQKLSEAALRESEEKFRCIFESSNVGLFIVTQNSTEILSNQAICDMLGYSATELQHSYLLTFTHPDDVDLNQRMMNTLLSGAEVSVRFITRFLHRNGSVVWANLNSTLRRSDDGRPLYLITAVIDITERKRMEEEVLRLNETLEKRVRDRTAQLEVANRELEAFSYSVSHDLRAPLRAMDGFSQALLEDYATQLDERGRDYLQRVRGATARMAALIDDLLALARVTRADLRREHVDLSALAREVIDELRQAEPQRTVEVSIAAGLTGEGDPRLLRVVLVNLLGNAWKFTGKQAAARIAVGTLPVDGQVAFLVRDNGAGFDMAYAGKLFGAFQRLHSTAEFSGTGIGLASVQRIIHRHGGRVWAESAPGQGATFYFTLMPSPPHGAPSVWSLHRPTP